jgi:hypothetical protein
VVKAAIADQRNDPVELRYLNDDITTLSRMIIAPVALGALISGVVMVLLSTWSFTDACIAVGFAGFASTFVIGVGVILPRSRKLRQLTERHGEVHPIVVVERRRLRLIGRFDVFLLFLIVYVMVIKPSADDAGILAAVAAGVALSATLLAFRMRAVSAG